MGNISHISFVIFEPLKMIMSDSPLSRAGACEGGRGLQVWRARHRSLLRKPRHAQIHNEIRHCSSCRKRCHFGRIRGRRSWWQIMSCLSGSELALDKLVPQGLPSVIVSRVELFWVEVQMEHARGATQAQQISAAASAKCQRYGMST